MGKITSMHFTGWKLGLKTGMYYLRTMAASAPIQFTVDQEQLKVVDTNVARVSRQKARCFWCLQRRQLFTCSCSAGPNVREQATEHSDHCTARCRDTSSYTTAGAPAEEEDVRADLVSGCEPGVPSRSRRRCKP